MELDWSTFILEIVNFAILMWLLSRFFYKPVAGIIATRRHNIQATLDEAGKTHAEAEALKSSYENRLTDWDKERALARTALHEELEAERRQAASDLETHLATERDRARAMIARETEDAREQVRRESIEEGLSFTAAMLGRLASPELEIRLIRLAIEDMAKLTPDQLDMLRLAREAAGGKLVVTSVWPVDVATRDALTDALGRMPGERPTLEFHQDPSLIAGLCVDFGSYKMDANLKAELQFFARNARHHHDR